MSQISSNIAWQTQQFRQDHGTSVRWNGVDYPCTTENVSSAQVGADKLPWVAIGAFIASADPRVFRLIPAQFKPVTTVTPPQEGSEFVWHDLKYRVSRVTYEDIDMDTHTVACFAYREVV